MEKVIHYCWFGPRPLGKLEKKCIKSWEKYLPDYKIIKWSEANVDLNECEFIREAYAQKKWAYVADYARTKALYEHGGIYFDTDMEVIKKLDKFEDKEFVVGIEDSGLPNAAIVFCKSKKNKYMKELLNTYKNMKFNETGDLFDICIPKMLEKLFRKYDFKKDCKDIQVLNKDIFIYPRDYFYPLSYDMQNNIFTDNTCTIHHFSASWTDTGEKISVWLKRHKMAWAVKPAWSVLDKYRRIKKRIFKKNDK